MMNKIIDCKYKETYFNIKPIQDEDEQFDSRMNFWIKMNTVAIQNMTIQRMKTA